MTEMLLSILYRIRSDTFLMCMRRVNQLLARYASEYASEARESYSIYCVQTEIVTVERQHMSFRHMNDVV